MMKKQMIVALVLVLLIPMVLMLGGLLFSMINPEIAAGHPNYAWNFHLLNLLKIMSLWTSAAVVVVLWTLACFLVIRSKQRSHFWLFFAVLGPVGFAILVRLSDRSPTESDRHARFVGNLSPLMRVGYETCVFVGLWLVAYQAMVLKRTLMVLYESAVTGLSTAQILDRQNASSGMWAFGEGLEVMYLVVLFYLLWPIVFNIGGRVAATVASPKLR